MLRRTQDQFCLTRLSISIWVGFGTGFGSQAWQNYLDLFNLLNSLVQNAPGATRAGGASFYSEATPASFCPNSVLDPSDDGISAGKQNPSVQVECCVKELPLLCYMSKILGDAYGTVFYRLILRCPFSP